MSAALAPARRLTVPATRRDSREILVTAPPFFLRDPAAPPTSDPALAASPPLLSFDGADFMEDFLAGAAAPERLPRLLAWRDWAEPPASMLDAVGTRLHPTSVRRAPPLAIEPETEAAGVLDPDGVPHGDPAWLRKLYLPLHLRFTLVAFDLLCERQGWPRVAKSRILGSGAVVRRLVRDPAGERWEDWISVDGKRGVWFELAGGLPADPEAIPDAAWGGQDAPLKARLELKAETPLPKALDSARLSLLPATVAGAAAHTTLYGLLPVLSAAEQAQDKAPPALAADIAAAMAAETDARLTTAWSDAPGQRAAIRAALSNLLALTVTPSAPTDGQVAAARNSILSFGMIPSSTLDTTLRDVVRKVIADGFAALAPSAGVIGPTGAAATFWSNAEHSTQWSSGNPTVALSFSARLSDWRVLIRDRLRRAIDGVLIPTGAPSTDAELGVIARGVMAVALLRVRAFRLALLANLHAQMFGEADTAALAAVTPLTFQGVTYQTPAATTGALSVEIEAVYGLDTVTSPADAVPTWSPLNRAHPANADAVHRAALALESLFNPLDEAGAAGGSAYETRLAKLIVDEIAPGITGAFGLPNDPIHRLRTFGLDLFEQPARGLLVFPGPTPEAATFATMRQTVAASYTASVPVAVTESRGRARVHRLRYDHDNVFAVWCWTRVAGHTACEKAKLVWTGRSEPFTIAEPTDILGARPVTVQLPDLAKLVRDIPRIAKARAKPFAAFNTPPNSGYNVGDDPKDTSRAWGVGWICSFAIPVITICAFILFSIIFSILIALPGFAWMLLLKFCIPIPVPKKS
ncbi:hypothetical protein AS593_07295 [Caulobacter vibrioides]|nr:hypothetical protein AS593_07295 [Caulobacter vibrioides]